MPGLNVYSFARLHGSKVAQVDIIPTTNLKLAKWAYYNDPQDLKAGLKGSHRNELLFAIAKYAEYKVTAKAADGQETARSRLTFDLSRGLYRSTQDKAGKRGITKSFKTTDKALVTNDPDKICAILFGRGVSAKQVMNYADAFKLLSSAGFPHKAQLKQILQRTVEGLESKKLVVPHELRQACTEKLNEDVNRRKIALTIQQAIIDRLPKHNVKLEDGGEKVVVYDPMGDSIYSTGFEFIKKDDEMLKRFATMCGEYAEKAAFFRALRKVGFGKNYDNGKFELNLDDRMLRATEEHPLTIYVCTHDRFDVARVRVRNVEQFDAAFKFAKLTSVDKDAVSDAIAGHRVEQVFEEVGYTRRVMLKLQQELIDFDPAGLKHAGPVKLTGGVLTASWQCDDKWEITAHQLVHDKNHDKLSISITSSSPGFDVPLEYILRRNQSGNVNDISVFVNGGMLTDGDDSRECPTWDEAVELFIHELDETIGNNDGAGPH